MNTNMTGFILYFNNRYVIVLWMKVALALEGLIYIFGLNLVSNDT